MRIVNLTELYDFIHVLIIKRRHSTMKDYFSKHIKFTNIYLQQNKD
jgi:hypothetical protein